MEYYFKTYCLPLALECVPLVLNYLLNKKKEKRESLGRLRFLVVKVSAWLEDYTLWAIDSFHKWSSYLLVEDERPNEKFICFAQKAA